jgi:predicted GTPase
MTTKVIILIGKTGSGKSTLANVLSGTDKFKESDSSIGVTKDIQKEEFIESGINYAVIDTVGIGDAQLKKEEVLDKIAEAVYLARKGVSQILFAVIGRLDQYEMSIYNLLKAVIFDEEVADHTTIIRTNFVDFRNKKKCEEDIDLMIKKGGDKLLEAIKSCQGRVIHVDNPSTDTDDEDEAEMNEEDRKVSREKILNHLKGVCGEDYKPQKLQELSAEIVDFMERKIESKKKLAERLREKKKEKISVSSNQNVESSKDKSENNAKDSDTESVVKKEERQVADKSQDLKSEKKTLTKLRITALEKEIKELEETKKLIEEIQETDRVIRQRVLKHIFNNYSDINQVTGGNIFINSIVGDRDNFSFTNKISFAGLKKKVEELEKELQKKRDNSRSLDEIKNELGNKEQELLNLKKELLSIKEIAEE